MCFWYKLNAMCCLIKYRSGYLTSSVWNIRIYKKWNETCISLTFQVFTEIDPALKGLQGFLRSTKFFKLSAYLPIWKVPEAFLKLPGQDQNLHLYLIYLYRCSVLEKRVSLEARPLLMFRTPFLVFLWNILGF